MDTARGWITPAGVAGGLTKYLGADVWWSVVVAIIVPFVIEVAGFLIGSFLYRRGGIAQDYSMALSKDPYRQESLELFRRISLDLAALLARTVPEHSGSDPAPRSRPSTPR